MDIKKAQYLLKKGSKVMVYYSSSLKEEEPLTMELCGLVIKAVNNEFVFFARCKDLRANSVLEISLDKIREFSDD